MLSGVNVGECGVGTLVLFTYVEWRQCWGVWCRHTRVVHIC